MHDQSPVKTGTPAVTGAPDLAGDLIFSTGEPLPGIWPKLRPNSPAGGASVATLESNMIFVPAKVFKAEIGCGSSF